MATTVRHVVSRLNWRESVGVWCRLPGDTRVASFVAADDAAADRATREQAARERLNPFRCGTAWHERTAMPEPVFRDYLQDADIAPPEDGEPWAEWWEATAPTLTPDQKSRVWEGLTGLRFYTIEERPSRPVAYAVVRINWQYNDEWYYPDAEGGTVEALYRTRARAEAVAAERTAAERVEWREQFAENRRLYGPDEEDQLDRDQEFVEFDMQGRRFPDQDPFDPHPRSAAREFLLGEEWRGRYFGLNEVPFYEVIEVELEGGAA